MTFDVIVCLYYQYIVSSWKQISILIEK